MKQFALQVSLGHGEVPTSFVSRLGAENGIDTMRRFCRLMGTTPEAVAGGHDDAIHVFGSTTSASRADLAAFAVKRREKDFRWIGENKLRATEVTWHRMRFCPRCFVQDVQADGKLAFNAAHVRVWWLVPYVTVCRKHRVRLVEPPWTLDKALAGDVARYVRDRWSEVRRLADDATPDEGHDVEAYFEERLLGRRAGGDMLDSLPTYAAAEACVAFGLFHASGIDGRFSHMTGDERRTNLAKGFEIMRVGCQGVLDYIDDRFNSTKRNWRGTTRLQLYGPVYRLLATRWQNPDLAPLCELIREDAMRRIPFAAGDEFLGKVSHRRLHSIRSASVASGFHYITVRKLLAKSGLLPDNHELLSDGDVLIDAAVMDRLLEEQRAFVQIRDICTRLGLSPGPVSSIIACGLIAPLPETRSGKVGYSMAAVEDFINRVVPTHTSELVPDGFLGLRTFGSAVGRSWGAILLLVRDGKLHPLLPSGGERNIKSLRFDPEEVRQIFGIGLNKDLSMRQVEQKLRTGGGCVEYLCKSGLLRSYQGTHRWMGRSKQTYVRAEDLDAFEREYISLSRLSAIRKIHIAKLKRELRRQGVLPVTQDGAPCSFYRRCDVDQ